MFSWAFGWIRNTNYITNAQNNFKWVTKSSITEIFSSYLFLEPNYDNCTFSSWTCWKPCSTSCGMGVQIRARNRLSGSSCQQSLYEYRSCQLQPCTCTITKQFYERTMNRNKPADGILLNRHTMVLSFHEILFSSQQILLATWKKMKRLYVLAIH